MAICQLLPNLVVIASLLNGIGGEVGVLIIDHCFLNTVRSGSFDHELDFTLVVESREEVCGLVDGIAESEQSMILEDTAFVLRSQGSSNVGAFFRC